MKLEVKLGIGKGILILAMLLSASVASFSLTRMARMARELGNQRRPFVIKSQALQSELANSIVALESSLVFSPQSPIRADNRDRLFNVQNAIASDLGALKNLDDTLNLGPDEGKLLWIAPQIAEMEGREQEAERQINLGTAAGLAHARTILEQQILPLNTQINRELAGIVASQGNIVNSQLATLQKAGQTTSLTLWAATILGALLGGLISLVISRRVVRGINRIAARASAVASGDLTGPDLDIGTSDQAGALARAMKQMQHGLADIIGTVADTSRSLTASAVSMSSAADHIHRRVEQQAQQTQQAATAMQEMSASIAEVSRHTKSAAETACSAAQTAHEGDAIVKQMLESMAQVAIACKDASSAIGLLGDDSHRISQIVTVIDEIATKTNLLALNAAIEAARAGDQGRGFAVVAGEVRRLAESTAQATGEIAAMIQGIQQRTQTAIACMASGSVTVEQGVVTTHRAGEALERIIGIAEQVDRMITQIAIAASQQAVAADQSSSSLDFIHTLSNDNLSEMATTTAGIESLRATAAALESQVEHFRLNTRPKIYKPQPSSPHPHGLPHLTSA